MIHYLESINRPINYTGAGGVVEGVTIVKNPSGEVIGPETIVDGEFAAACGVNWTCNGDAVISGGTVTFSANGLTNYVTSQPTGIALEDDVRITINILQNAPLGLALYIGGNNKVAVITGTGLITVDAQRSITSIGDTIFLAAENSSGDPIEVALLSVKIITVIPSDEEVTATHIPIQTFPSELIGFEVPWTADPVAGDVVEFRYDEVTGAYEDPNALDEFDQPIPLKSQTVALISCLNIGFGNLVDSFNNDNLIDSNGVDNLVES